MFSMKHDIKEQDSLLRGDFLAIVAAMMTRLERFSSAQQLYIPVSEVYPSIVLFIYYSFIFVNIFQGSCPLVHGSSAWKGSPGLL